MATDSPTPIDIDPPDHEIADGDGDVSMPDADVTDTPDATTDGDEDNAEPPNDGDASTSSDDPFDDDEDEDLEKGDDTTKSDDPSSALLQALEHKNSGNAHFAADAHIEASRCYRKGLSCLKPYNKLNSGDEQVKALLVSLNTNLSMVCYKQLKYKLAKDAAGKALEIEEGNVKALYRRALANRALGEEDAALVDLKKAYKIDAGNSAVKKEIAQIRKSRETQKMNEKERLQKAFSSGSLLYGDKEEEERRAQKRRAQEKKERMEREEKEREKRKKEWEDDCVERLKDGKEVLSFDQWDEERVKREIEEKERKEKEKKEQEKKRREERKAAKKNQKDDTDSEDELTEKELAMLRGYKKTSDGRTTSYFTREQTEKEKELIGCIQPKRLESTATDESGASVEQPTTSSVGSVWNQAGTTWEEKDTTEWCKSCLQECLLDSMAVYASESGSGMFVAQVKEIDALTGDASVALAGGKKRYIYDFHTGVKYKILNEEKECIASGSLKLPDINSAHTAEEELEVDVLKWKKAPQEEGVMAEVETGRELLVSEVRKSVLKFVERFNANF